MCAWCGVLFIAQKTTTSYCSHKCSSLAYKKRKREELVGTISLDSDATAARVSTQSFDGKEYLTVAEVARLWGLNRQTVYNLLHDGKLRAVQFSSRLTLIRRSDLDSLFDQPEAYRARYVNTRREITELYTVEEIEKKFEVCRSWIYRVVKERRIPKTMHRGKAYYSKPDVDKWFTVKPEPILDWCSVDEAISILGVTRDALYHYIKQHDIPKQKVGKYIRISKSHIINLLNPRIL